VSEEVEEVIPGKVFCEDIEGFITCAKVRGINNNINIEVLSIFICRE